MDLARSVGGNSGVVVLSFSIWLFLVPVGGSDGGNGGGGGGIVTIVVFFVFSGSGSDGGGVVTNKLNPDVDTVFFVVVGVSISVSFVSSGVINSG